MVRVSDADDHTEVVFGGRFAGGGGGSYDGAGTVGVRMMDAHRGRPACLSADAAER